MGSASCYYHHFRQAQARSAGFQTCRIAYFQVGTAWAAEWPVYSAVPFVPARALGKSRLTRPGSFWIFGFRISAFAGSSMVVFRMDRDKVYEEHD